MSNSNDAPPPEAAVRRYLMSLQDPSTLVDEDSIRRAEAAVERATDPIDKLHALADLEQARQADGDQARTDFVTHARAWAEAEHIPASAFRELGVSEQVLKDAGFRVSRGPRRPRHSADGRGGTRAARRPLEQIKAATGRLPKRFTLSDLADAAGGGSPATLRKAVEQLMDEDKVRRIGPMESHPGRGRAPMVYELT